MRERERETEPKKGVTSGLTALIASDAFGRRRFVESRIEGATGFAEALVDDEQNWIRVSLEGSQRFESRPKMN